MSVDRAHEARRAFRRWTTAERERLIASGIPLAFWESYDNWLYFLDHSYVPYDRDPAQFNLEELSSAQLETLRDVIRSWRSEPYETDVERGITGIQRVRLRAENQDLFDELSAYFFDVDPMERNLGSNRDQYDPEVGTILPRIKELKSAPQIAPILREEFARWWQRDIRPDGPDFEEMADGVLAILQRHRRR